MKRVAVILLLLAFAAGGFVAGRLRGHHGVASDSAQVTRKVLYYVDPMNPAHTSDRPGLAPCGMKMEPVYADAALTLLPQGESTTVAPGTVRISPERQQLAGIQVSSVERKPVTHTLRLPGRVAVDETRVYHINAAVNGRIAGTRPCSTGSLVRKDEVLADVRSPELLPAVQSLLFALNTRDQPVDGVEPGVVAASSLTEIDLTYQQGLETLRHLGMGQRQLDEVIQTRKLVNHIAITSPVEGVLTARNVSDELHVEKGHELFRVADLRRVWILADVTGWEGEHLKPGSEVRVTLTDRQQTLPATMSHALPLFDRESLTLKVRLEADNPDYALSPDMLVDVELPIALPEMTLVAADAVLDTGRRQTVFVDQGAGFFEPREVKTGRHLGDRVEIVQGLSPGERIVTSGNFLLDSESRMKQAATAARERSTEDPVCGMRVDEQDAQVAGRFSVYQGQTYYFCHEGCQRRFETDPAKALSKAPPGVRETADASPAVEHLSRRP